MPETRTIDGVTCELVTVAHNPNGWRALTSLPTTCPAAERVAQLLSGYARDVVREYEQAFVELGCKYSASTDGVVAVIAVGPSKMAMLVRWVQLVGVADTDYRIEIPSLVQLLKMLGCDYLSQTPVSEAIWLKKMSAVTWIAR